MFRSQQTPVDAPESQVASMFPVPGEEGERDGGTQAWSYLQQPGLVRWMGKGENSTREVWPLADGYEDEFNMVAHA